MCSKSIKTSSNLQKSINLTTQWSLGLGQMTPKYALTYFCSKLLRTRVRGVVVSERCTFIFQRKILNLNDDIVYWLSKLLYPRGIQFSLISPSLDPKLSNTHCRKGSHGRHGPFDFHSQSAVDGWMSVENILSLKKSMLN